MSNTSITSDEAAWTLETAPVSWLAYHNDSHPQPIEGCHLCDLIKKAAL